MKKGYILMALGMVFFVALSAYALERATNPWPENGADDVSVYTDLAWDHDGDSSSLYFGTDPDRLYRLLDRSKAKRYDFSDRLRYNERYYWIVDVHYGNTTLEGRLWNFRTWDSSWGGVGIVTGCDIAGYGVSVLFILLPALVLSPFRKK